MSLTSIPLLLCGLLIAYTSAALQDPLTTLYGSPTALDRMYGRSQWRMVPAALPQPEVAPPSPQVVIGQSDSNSQQSGSQGSSRGGGSSSPNHSLPDFRDRCHSADFMTLCSSTEGTRDVQCRQRCRRPRLFGFSKGFGQACYCCECL